MAWLKKINNLLCWILQAGCLALVITYSVCVFFQVLARNYIKISVNWSDEIALILFVWSVFMGAAVGLRKRGHFLVDVLPKSMARTNSSADLFASLLVLFMVMVLFIGGVTFTRMGMRNQFNSIKIKQSWLYISMPVSAGCMALFSVENIINDIKKLKAAFSGAAEGGKPA